MHLKHLESEIFQNVKNFECSQFEASGRQIAVLKHVDNSNDVVWIFVPVATHIQNAQRRTVISASKSSKEQFQW